MMSTRKAARRFATLTATGFMLLAATALANGTAEFKVTDIAPRPDGKTALVTVAFNQVDNGSQNGKGVQFYAHTKLPAYGKANTGTPIGTQDLAGTGTATFTVNLEQLGLQPGQTLFIAAHWPGSNHNWGTADGNRANGTSMPIPGGPANQAQTGEAAAEGQAQSNSSLARFGRRLSRRAPRAKWSAKTTRSKVAKQRLTLSFGKGRRAAPGKIGRRGQHHRRAHKAPRTRLSRARPAPRASRQVRAPLRLLQRRGK